MADITPTTTSADLEKQAAPIASPPPSDLRRFLTDLLAIQCELVGAVAGVAYLVSGAGAARKQGLATGSATGSGMGLAAKHARAEDGDTLLALLQPSLERAADELTRERLSLEAAGAPLIHGKVEMVARPTKRAGLYGSDPQHRVIATPLVSEGVTRGAAVLVFGSAAADARGRLVAPGPEDEQAMALLALTNARLEAFLWREHAMQEAEQKLRLRETLELIDSSQQGTNAGSMGALFCHELKRRFQCTRVSIGLAKGERIRVVAISGVDQVDANSPVVRSLEAVFDECADQDIEVLYPPTPSERPDPMEQRVTRAHEEHSRKHGPAALLSLPLRVEGDLVGVALLEREASEPFPPGAASLVRLVAEYIGPALWTRRLADRGVLLVTRDRALDFARAMVGPRHTGAKLVAAILLIVLLLAALVPIARHVSADFEVRALVSRAIVPPFTGYLEESLVRSGDEVKAGQVIARMDIREAQQQLAVEESRRDQLRFQRDEAQSQGEAAKQRVFEAQLQGALATIRQIEDQISRAAIASPIDGIVGRGDLERLIGARVDPTQSLFEIITPRRLAVVHVRERDVHRVEAGQEGDLVVRARTGEAIPIKVSRIAPMSEVVRGENVFAVECEVLGEARELTPGMSGSARIRAGDTTLLARVLEPLVDEARLRFWW